METLWQKNIIFMSMDKRLKSVRRYIKSTGENENMKKRAGGQEKPLALFFIIGS